MKKLLLIMVILGITYSESQIKYPWGGFKGDTIVFLMGYKTKGKSGQDTVVTVDSVKNYRLPVSAVFGGSISVAFDTTKQRAYLEGIRDSLNIKGRIYDSVKVWLNQYVRVLIDSLQTRKQVSIENYVKSDSSTERKSVVVGNVIRAIIDNTNQPAPIQMSVSQALPEGTNSIGNVNVNNWSSMRKDTVIYVANLPSTQDVRLTSQSLDSVNVKGFTNTYVNNFPAGFNSNISAQSLDSLNIKGVVRIRGELTVGNFPTTQNVAITSQATDSLTVKGFVKAYVYNFPNEMNMTISNQTKDSLTIKSTKVSGQVHTVIADQIKDSLNMKGKIEISKPVHTLADDTAMVWIVNQASIGGVIVDSLEASRKQVSIENQVKLDSAFTRKWISIDNITDSIKLTKDSIRTYWLRDTTHSMLGVKIMNFGAGADVNVTNSSFAITSDSSKITSLPAIKIRDSVMVQAGSKGLRIDSSTSRKQVSIENQVKSDSAFTRKWQSIDNIIGTVKVAIASGEENVHVNEWDTTQAKLPSIYIKGGTIIPERNHADSTNNRLVRIEANTDKLRVGNMDSLTNLLREQQGYRYTDDSLVTKVIEKCLTVAGAVADSSGSWTRIWKPSIPDSTKNKVISFISLSTTDSTVGYQIFAVNGTAKRLLFFVPRLVPNAQVVMNFVGSPLILSSSEHLYARMIVNAGAHYSNYVSSISTNAGFPALTITVKYKYR